MAARRSQSPASVQPSATNDTAVVDDDGEAQDSAAPSLADTAPTQPLPEIETLTAESDYTPFMGRDVPDTLRNVALRKLWRSDPVFANLDGLNDYDENFRTMGLGKVVATAYRIGRGMIRDQHVHKSDDRPNQVDQPNGIDANQSRAENVERRNQHQPAQIDDERDRDGVAEPDDDENRHS